MDMRRALRAGIGLCAGGLALFVGCGHGARVRPPVTAPVSSAVAQGATEPPSPLVAPALGYAPLAARGLDRIEAALSLDRAERGRLKRDGMVISRQRFPTFGLGLASIYKDDLPLYVSADAILDAVHRSFDALLMDTERSMLRPELDALLGNMRARLAKGAARGFSRQARAGVDEYLAIALALLNGKPPELIAGGDRAEADRIVRQAMAASGRGDATLFGSPRTLDFSQFKPRGHYERTDLEGYFRAVIWLGRTDLRVLDYDDRGRPELDRRQLEGMLVLYKLLDADEMARWKRIDYALGTFVGPPDYAGPAVVKSLLSQAKVTTPKGLLALSDAALSRVIEGRGFGAQRIASHVRGDTATKTPRPQARSFALLGQRYVADSEVLSHLVHDRVPRRLMPKPLDVAYAALGNDHAKQFLSGDLKNERYASALSKERERIDSLGPAYWRGTLYTSWFGALRELSSGDGSLPKVTTGDAWALRMLGTQLASWAELRHDTVAYAKQSYTASIQCEFPAAYVEPYPRFFAALRNFAHGVKTLASSSTSELFRKRAGDYAAALDASLARLEEMAARELRGEELTAEDLAFINDAVVLHTKSIGCSSTEVLDGWYPRMLYAGANPLKSETHIVDVHTQPTDLGGAEVGRVLHVATGSPQAMIVTIDTCNGPTAYVGLVSPFYEVVTEHYQRLSDSDWATQISRHRQAAWLAPILRSE